MVDFKRIELLQNQERKFALMVIKADARAKKVTSVITGMPRGGSSNNSQEDRMIELVAIKEIYNDVSNELKRRRDELETLIRFLDDPNENLAIQLRYLRGNTVGGVCEKMNYSETQVRRFLRRGEANINRSAEKDGRS